MSYDVRLESIKAYKRMIKHFKREIAKLEKEIFSETCCFKETNKERIYIRQIHHDELGKNPR